MELKITRTQKHKKIKALELKIMWTLKEIHVTDTIPISSSTEERFLIS
jgi:hypothetical protein